MQTRSRFRAPRALVFGALLFSLPSLPALAGPPFQTDGPGTTLYQYFDLHFASDYTHTFEGVDYAGYELLFGPRVRTSASDANFKS